MRTKIYNEHLKNKTAAEFLLNSPPNVIGSGQLQFTNRCYFQHFLKKILLLKGEKKKIEDKIG